jgi:hypothetical protein
MVQGPSIIARTFFVGVSDAQKGKVRRIARRLADERRSRGRDQSMEITIVNHYRSMVDDRMLISFLANEFKDGDLSF